LLLFLTYHRVLPSPHPKPEFYDISAANLEKHLQVLSRSTLKALTPGELLTGPPDKPSFILSFDDGTRDHFDVVSPLLLRYSCQAIFFVPTTKLNRTGYLTDEMLHQMSESKHYIGLHSHEHRRMDAMSDSEIHDQMRISREQIQKLTGASSAIFAPPGGFINSRVRTVALEVGVRSIRTMHWGYNKHPDPNTLQCVPINSRTTESKFYNIVQFRGSNLTYILKEGLKTILPMALYQRLRDTIYMRGDYK